MIDDHLTGSHRWSPLALWHPDGISRATAIFGAGCPASLLPTRDFAADAQLAHGSTSLVIVAPTSAESRAKGWLDDTIGRAATACERDGVIHILVGAAQGLKVATLLRKH